MRTNACEISRGGKKVGCALSVLMGWHNHDCLPNAQATVDEEGLVSVRALRDMRCLAQGLAADEVLHGVRMASPEDVAAVASVMPQVTALLAMAGEADAMAETAALESAAGHGKAAVAWMAAAVRKAEREGDAAQHMLAMSGCASYQLLERLAELQLRELGDEGAAAAAESFEAAAEAPLEAGKMKLYQRLGALAAQHAPDE